MKDYMQAIIDYVEDHIEDHIEDSLTLKDIEKGHHGYGNYLLIPKDEYDQIDDCNVIKKEVERSRYVKLTIYNPFCDPFERIPTGLKKLSAFLNERQPFNESVAIPCFEEKVTMMIKLL